MVGNGRDVRRLGQRDYTLLAERLGKKKAIAAIFTKKMCESQRGEISTCEPNERLFNFCFVSKRDGSQVYQHAVINDAHNDRRAPLTQQLGDLVSSNTAPGH